MGYSRFKRFLIFSITTFVVIFYLQIKFASSQENSPLGIYPVSWQAPSSAAVLSAFIGFGEHQIYQERKQTCLKSQIIFFKVNDDFAFDLQETVRVTVVYDSRFGPDLILNYDGRDRPVSLPIDQEKVRAFSSDSERLREHTFVLEGARFANQFPGYMDFNLVGSDYKTIAVCDVKIERTYQTPKKQNSGRLELRIADAATGISIPGQVGIYNEQGKYVNPSERALPIYLSYGVVHSVALWFPYLYAPPFDGRYSFYVNKTYETSLAPGQYDLLITRGPEFHVYRCKLAVEPGQTLKHTALLQRWKNLPAKGWYSGDNHVHIERSPQRNESILAQMKAADLHVTSLLEMGNIKSTYYPQYAFGKSGTYREGGFFLVSGQEEPRTAHLGHVIFLNTSSPIHFKNSYFNYHQFLERAAEQNALSGFAHQGKLFHSARGLALEVPFQKVGFIEVLQSADCFVDKWYEFLNLGYKMIPLAGSDFPYIDLPGSVRNYVSVEGIFSPQSWFAALKQGKTYVTNGPMLDFTVNGSMMGSELKVKKGGKIKIHARAQLNPDLGRLKRLELISQGKVLRDVTSKRGREELVLEYEYSAEESHWLAVKATGSNGQAQVVAHTAPVYVVVKDAPFWSESEVSALVASQVRMLHEIESQPLVPKEDLEWWQTKTDLERQWNAQKKAVIRRVGLAKEKYQSLLKRLSPASKVPGE